MIVSVVVAVGKLYRYCTYYHNNASRTGLVTIIVSGIILSPVFLLLYCNKQVKVYCFEACKYLNDQHNYYVINFYRSKELH